MSKPGNTPEPTSHEPDAGKGTPSGEDEKLGEGGKKALAAERDARKAAEREKADLQKQLDAINAENMSDLEKAQAQAKAAEETAAKATRDALRYRYAAKHGISDEDAELFLTGETEEQVAAQAERFASHTAATTASGTPKPDLTQGGNGKPIAASTGEQFAQFIESKLT